MKIEQLKALSDKAYELELLESDLIALNYATDLVSMPLGNRIQSLVDLEAIRKILADGISKRIEALQAEIDAA